MALGVGCEKQQSADVGGAQPVAQIQTTSAAPVSSPTLVPAPTVAPTAIPAQYSVIKNWGWRNEQMPFTFNNILYYENGQFKTGPLTIGKTYKIYWRQYPAGSFLVNGTDIRQCYGDITIQGTDTAGTITIANTAEYWSIDPAEAMNNPPCPTSLEGVYSYNVDANGMNFNGTYYQEQ